MSKKLLYDIHNIKDIDIETIHNHIRHDQERFEAIQDRIEMMYLESQQSRKQLEEKMDLLIDTINPLVDIYDNSRGLFITVTAFLKGAAMIGAAVSAIIYITKMLR